MIYPNKESYRIKIEQNFLLHFHFLKITTKFSQKQKAILKICPDFINNNYKNFLKYFSTVFKVSLKFLLKLPEIFSKLLSDNIFINCINL